MFDKTRRYLKILWVLFKYDLFRIAYRELRHRRKYGQLCGCEVDMGRRDNAVRLRKALEELGPTFIKLGQAMSKRPDIISIEYCKELESLQEAVRTLEFDKMKMAFELSCICEGGDETHHPLCYHCQFENLFDEFDKEPIASASIAQVYRAVLKGEEVAVKIARPDVLDVITLDLKILNDLKFIVMRGLGLGSRKDIDGFLDEFKSMLLKELDYRNEALNMERFRENFKGFKGVKVPKVYWDYTRENVLVMEFIHGTPLRKLVASPKKKKELVKLIASSYLKQVYIDGYFHGDPHTGNIFVLDEGIAFLDFGAMGKIDSALKKDMYNIFYAVYIKDAEMATKSLLKLAGVNAEDIDISSFKQDMDDLIAKQHYSRSGERKSDNFVKLALKYNIEMPRVFSLLERALLLIEAVCIDLDPGFNLMSEAEGFAGQVVRARYSPRRLIEEFQRSADDYYELIRDLPYGMKDIIDTVRGYKLAFQERKKDDTGRVILKAAFVLMLMVVSAALMLAATEPLIKGIGGAGFVIGVAFGVVTVFRR